MENLRMKLRRTSRMEIQLKVKQEVQETRMKKAKVIRMVSSQQAQMEELALQLKLSRQMLLQNLSRLTSQLWKSQNRYSKVTLSAF
jgi:hypothetical protein